MLREHGYTDEEARRLLTRTRVHPRAKEIVAAAFAPRPTTNHVPPARERRANRAR